MKIEEYADLAARTAKPLPLAADLEHAVLGLISDWGEVVTHIKAYEVYGKGILLSELAEELGDTCWFLALFARLMGITFADLGRIPTFDPRFGSLTSNEVRTAFLGSVAIGDLCADMDYGMEIHQILQPQARVLARAARLFHCIVRMCDLYGLVLEDDVLEPNIAKLRRRYPEKYSDQDAIARADKVGFGG